MIDTHSHIVCVVVVKWIVCVSLINLVCEKKIETAQRSVKKVSKQAKPKAGAKAKLAVEADSSKVRQKKYYYSYNIVISQL